MGEAESSAGAAEGKAPVPPSAPDPVPKAAPEEAAPSSAASAAAAMTMSAAAAPPPPPPPLPAAPPVPVVWSPEVEVCLFHAMLGHKPVGERRRGGRVGLGTGLGLE